MPEGAHPLPLSGKGWSGKKNFVDLDGENWPLAQAAQLLEIPEKDLRDLVRIAGLEPSGVIRMSSYSRQGRQPRAYPADKLIMIGEFITDLKASLS
jgi:hypothetical protein